METPVCRICGGPIKYDRPKKLVKKVFNQEYTLCVCQQCLFKKFPNIKNFSRIFNTNNEVTCYAFNIPKEIAEQSNSKYAWTEAKAIQKYGEVEGKKKWEEYIKKQAYTNTFEYKQKKYGWSIEEFNKYNKSRAVTLKNLINRHGEEIGRRIWENYCERQSLTKSWNWMVNQYGEEKAKEINKQKSLTLENFIKKYGEIEGEERWEAYCLKRINPYSQISQILFMRLDKYLSKKYTTYYATKGDGEWFVKAPGRVYYLDYYIRELNICIEFNGNTWHGNPKMFNKSDHCHPIYRDVTAGELQENDKKRINFLKSKGIKTYIIWESDYNEKSFDYIQYISNVLKINIDEI